MYTHYFSSFYQLFPSVKIESAAGNISICVRHDPFTYRKANIFCIHTLTGKNKKLRLHSQNNFILDMIYTFQSVQNRAEKTNEAEKVIVHSVPKQV